MAGYLKNIAAIILGFVLSILVLLVLDRLFVLNLEFMLKHSSVTTLSPTLQNLQISASEILQKSVLDSYSKIPKINPLRSYQLEYPKFQEKTDNAIKKIHAVLKTKENDTIYDVKYTTDLLGRRQTPRPVNKKSDTSVVFIGCSFTYGEGLNDDQTYPYFVGKLLSSDINVFNLGIRGAGPNDILFDLEQRHPDFFDIPAKKIILVYGFISNHLERISCSYRCYGSQNWLLEKPKYIMENGQAVWAGNFKDDYSNPLIGSILRLFYFTTKAEVPLNLTTVESKENIILYYKILEKIHKKLNKKYEIVANYSVYLNMFSNAQSLINKMEEANATNLFKPIIIPYPELAAKTDFNSFFIPIDRHASSFSNEVTAMGTYLRLKKDLPFLIH